VQPSAAQTLPSLRDAAGAPVIMDTIGGVQHEEPRRHAHHQRKDRPKCVKSASANYAANTGVEGLF
jgi:hypothetical protein